MFKLSVTESPSSAQRNEILIKEISFLSSIIVALAIFLLLAVLFCISKYRGSRYKMPPNVAGATLDEMDAIFGNCCDQPCPGSRRPGVKSLFCSELESSALVYPRDCSPGATPRWASQRLLTSSPRQHFLTARHKNFTSPSLRSLSPSLLGSCTDLRDLRTTRRDTTQFRETNFSATTSTPGTPPPRPPRYSKSLGHINKLADQHQKRRRSVARCKSSHSLFECSEGCFDMEDIEANKSFGQLVTITTGPILC